MVKAIRGRIVIMILGILAIVVGYWGAFIGVTNFWRVRVPPVGTFLIILGIFWVVMGFAAPARIFMSFRAPAKKPKVVLAIIGALFITLLLVLCIPVSLFILAH